MPDANIKEVYFERVFNLGAYESFRIGYTATVGPTDKIEDVPTALDKRTVQARNDFLRPVKPGKEIQ